MEGGTRKDSKGDVIFGEKFFLVLLFVIPLRLAVGLWAWVGGF